MQNNGQNDKDLFSEIELSDVVKINDELNAFHERIERWFKKPEQPTKGRLRI